MEITCNSSLINYQLVITILAIRFHTQCVSDVCHVMDICTFKTDFFIMIYIVILRTSEIYTFFEIKETIWDCLKAGKY